MMKTYKNKLGFAIGSTLEWCRDSWKRNNDLNRSSIFYTPFIPFIAYGDAEKHKDSAGNYLLHKLK